MAQDDDLDLDMDGDEEEAPKSKSKLLIIIIAVVLILGVSATATLMFTGILSGDDEVMAEEGESDGKSDKQKSKPKKSKPKKAKAPLNYIPLDPPFVVNFSGDTDIRFLQVTLQVGTRDPSVVALVKEHRPAIRNSLVFLFGSQDPTALSTRAGKEALRGQTLAEIQKVMKSETGSAGVDSVFFTSFVMQ